MLYCVVYNFTLRVLKFVFIYFKFLAYLLKLVGGTTYIGGSSVTFTLTSHMPFVRSFRGLVIPTTISLPSVAMETKLVIGWELLSLGRPTPTTAGVTRQVTSCFLQESPCTSKENTEGHSFKTLRFFQVIRLCSHRFTFMLMTWKFSSIFSTVIARIFRPTSFNLIFF